MKTDIIIFLIIIILALAFAVWELDKDNDRLDVIAESVTTSRINESFCHKTLKSYIRELEECDADTTTE